MAFTPQLAPYPLSLAGALLAAREAVMAPIRPCLRAAGVTDQQWRVLRVLASGELLDASQVARLALLYPPTVSRILRELAARGLLSRSADPHDRRKTLVCVTEAGRALIEQTAGHTQVLLRQYQMAFGDERLARLIGELTDLSQTLAPFAAGEGGWQEAP